MDEHDNHYVQATWSWDLKLKDIHNNNISLKITSPINFIFDTLYLLLVDMSDFSSTQLLINSNKEQLEIPLININFRSKLHIYGLKHVHTKMGHFDQVVCYGENDPNLTEDNATICIDLKEPKDESLPLDNPTQGTLPVTVYRQPPSFYRLDVNHTFQNVQDFVVFVKIKDQMRCCFMSNNDIHIQFPFEFPSASEIACKVISGCRRHNILGKLCTATTISHSKTIIFNTFLSVWDNIRLYNLAIFFDAQKVMPGFKPIQYFYRNKSVEYFTVIMNNLNGEMRPYLKSNGGEQCSVLNGRLSGLFFSSFLEYNTNRPNLQSYYGPVRLYIQTQIMLNPFCNIYFADFYCHYKRHHVTLVVTPKGSVSDKFCTKYLLLLNIFNNPYLYLRHSENGSFIVFANMNVTVEVFYTETLYLSTILRSSMGFLERTPTIGRGYALPSGIPKNVACKICNLG